MCKNKKCSNCKCDVNNEFCDVEVPIEEQKHLGDGIIQRLRNFFGIEDSE